MKDSRIDVLRRIAFGRESTAEERAAATAELRELEAARTAEARRIESERENRRSLASEPGAAERSDSVAQDTATVSDPYGPSATADAPGLRHRTAVGAIWLVPIILASLAVGAIGGSLWSALHAPTTTPNAHSTFALGTDGSGQPGGDLAAADKIFMQHRTAQDVFPMPDLVQNLRQSSVRFLGGTSDAVQLWVGRNSEDELCLLVYESKSSSGAASCVTPANFTSQGVTLGFNQYQVSWNGTEFTVFMPYGS